MQLGLAETLQILIGENQTTEKGMELAKQIEQMFKDRCKLFKETYKLNFGVYFTPAENLAYTALKNFRKTYGEIPKVSDRDYFTNSVHVPVWEQMSPFDKIDIESQLTGYSSAGCITYVELDGGMSNNLDALETLVNYAMDKDIPYFAINIPNDICNDCGFTGEFNDVCPVCGSRHISHLRRVTGYLTGDYKTAFNWGKQKETEDRFRHGCLKVQLGDSKMCYMPNDFINGEGVCVSLWTVGCPFKCPGCHNQELWDFEEDLKLPTDIKGQIIKAISANGVQRNFSVLGGEPLCVENAKIVDDIVTAVRSAYANIKIYIWSGYTFEELEQLSQENAHIQHILSLSNYLIDGRFELENRDITLKLRGSSNQNIIDLEGKF